MTVALVDLWIGPQQGTFAAPNRPLDRGLLLSRWVEGNRPQREASVLAAADLLRAGPDTLVVFPGWTTIGAPNGPAPAWAVDLSRERTVVFEIGSRKTGWRTRVIRDGADIVPPVRQRLVDSDAVRTASPDVAALTADFAGGGRTWQDANMGRINLLVCGEVNVVGSASLHEAVVAAGLTDQHVRSAVVVHPTHTWMRLPAIAAKRAWLSRPDALVVTAANAHPSAPNDEGKRLTSYLGAAVWSSGEMHRPGGPRLRWVFNDESWEAGDFRVARWT
jgi:hypothetical protein